MNLRRIAVLLFAIGLGVMVAGPARAELVVVLVLPAHSSEDYEPCATRLRSELMASGFNVRVVREAEPPSATLLERIAAREGSAAAVAITLSPSAVSGLVWMRDAKAERSLERPVPPEARSGDTPAVFAIRATDVLHGGLLELGYPRPRPLDAIEPAPSASASSAAPAPVPSTVRPRAAPPPSNRAVRRDQTSPKPEPERKRNWGVEAGAAILWGPGPGGAVRGLPPAVAPTVAVEKRWSGGWAIGVRVVGPAVSSLQRQQDRATIDQELGLLSGGWRAPLGPALTLSIDAGVGVYRLGAGGEDRQATPAQSGSSGEANSAWSGCLHSGLGMGLSLGKRVAARWSVGVVVPRRVDVVFGSQTVASSGFPILATALGLHVSL